MKLSTKSPFKMEICFNVPMVLRHVSNKYSLLRLKHLSAEEVGINAENKNISVVC